MAICRHDLWRLGGLQIITRSFTTDMCSSNDAEGTGHERRGAVVRAKTEYLGCREEDLEEVTLQEHAAWWLAMKLRPGASLVVCHLLRSLSVISSICEGLQAAAASASGGSLCHNLLSGDLAR